MRIAAYMVVKDDAYYVDMAIKSVLQYVCGVYVQDQFSEDGTQDVVNKIKSDDPGGNRIVMERFHTGSGRFSSGYDEPKWRSLAVARCEELFFPHWILKLDADEIYTQYFFEKLIELERELVLENFVSVRVSGDRFISKTRRSIHPTSIEMSDKGFPFVDPHNQLWRAFMGMKYIQNPAFTRFHPILHPDPFPQYWLPGICNIHLHRTFGPKSLPFWQEGGDPPMQGPPYNPPSQSKKWYESDINLGNSEEACFDWPDYVLQKWEKWGCW
jgi:hypothetical protein